MKIDYTKIKKTKWYLQATDSVNYFLLGPAIAVEKLLSGGLNMIFYIQKDHCSIYVNEDFYDKLAEKEVHKILKNKNYLPAAHRNWIKCGASLTKEIQHVRNIKDVSRLSNGELTELNLKLGTLAFDIWVNPVFIDIFDPTGDAIIARSLQSAGVTLTQNELSSLLLPLKPFMAQQYHSDLYKVALNKVDKQKFVHDYYFINCSYMSGRGLTESIVSKEIKELDQSVNLRKEIKKIEDYNKFVAKEKRAIIKKHHLPQSVVRLLESFADLTLWRDQRKELLQKTVYALNILGQEIAKRSKVSWIELSQCLPYEISTVPVSVSVIKRAEKRLRDNFMVVWDPVAKKPVFLKKDVSLRLKKILTAVEDATELRGLVASSGKIQGKVRVVSGEKEFHTFQKGEILVTAMTRPEFLPLMKKAAAIVTDEGGITSHAAIVSRELGVPCIIGTKTATRVFKTGDLVEVNANHGWIRKLITQ